MKSLFILLVLVTILFATCSIQKKGSQGENFDSKVDQVSANIIDDSELLTFFENERKAINPRFEALPTGSNLPQGWLLDFMQNDLSKGIVGALDELYPGIKKDDLYNTARRAGVEDVPEMGDLVLTGAEWEQSIMWWNAETAGNWWDGFVRHAFLTDNKEAIQQSKEIVENLIASQDDDGYVGIYKENLRYQHEGSNGELWAQTTAFRTMLAYYEFTGDRRVLDAVEKAMALTMREYGEDGRNPFYLKNAFGGVTHGLMMTDVCETLHRITGKQEYQDYATFLYRAFSTYSINRAFNDMRYPFLVEKDSLFTGHGVHTYEHLRTLLNTYYNTGYPEMKTAWENALYKLDYCLLPSGAGHGNEWILAMKADPTFTTTEFCTMLELRNFYGSAIQKTGNVEFADRAEKLTFNGIMGFRNEQGTALTYGKGDNCYVLDGKHHGEHHSHDDPRYKYSPTHSEPAVCCVPNYTRNFTYFLDQMWMKADYGLAAVMYGPSLLKTKVNNINVSIEQITNYPFSDEIVFIVKTDKPVNFAIYLRKPGWSKSLDVELMDIKPTVQDGYYKIEKEWNSEEEIHVRINQEVKANEFQNGEVYFQRGPLVYAYEIPHTDKTIKSYEGSEFTDYYSFPKEKDYMPRKVKEDKLSSFTYNGGTISVGENPWYQSEYYLKGFLQDANGKQKEVKLVPMGSTVLRQVTFEKTDD
jgi:DUF1680 family protein